MKYVEYKSRLLDLSFGKNLKDAIYVYYKSLSPKDKRLKRFVDKLIKEQNIIEPFNVIKFAKHSIKLSFLYYPEFFLIPHPTLYRSVVVSYPSGLLKVICYKDSLNPPILHRKELLLRKNSKLIKRFSKLTNSEEAAGLYDNTRTIGFKKNWERLLKEKGLAYQGHKLVRISNKRSTSGDSEVEIKRHKTAITRYNFSKPIQMVQEHRLLSKSCSFFDYGCGKGDDVQALQKLGYNAVGWDPVFRPEVKKVRSDIVNLGFVINVIEDKAERSKTLKDSFGYTEKLLVVSTMVASSNTENLGKPYKDGIITKNNTFQKYFSQNKLRDYIETTLGTGAIAVGPGIFYVFKDPVEQQEFLSNRSRRSIDWVELSRGLYPDRPVRMRKKDVLYEANKGLVDRFWKKMLELGRIPRPEEFSETSELRSKFGTPNSARKLFVEKFGEETLKEAFELRKNDLLVYLALSNFKKQVPFYHLSIRLQNDIKTFLGSYKAGLEKSRKLLYSIGNPDIITDLCNRIDFGYFDHKALFIHKTLLKELHPVLRIYVGCAGVLYGDLENVDIIKIHKKSGKVTLLIYDDFEKKHLPELHQRVKVNLRKQRIDLFDHKSENTQQVLYYKERYVADGHPLRSKWLKFSKKLSMVGIDNTVVYGPTKQEFKELVTCHGLTPNLNRKK